MCFDQKKFREALGCFATGVVIVTGLNADRMPIGLTANSFSSVSLAPPLVLFCLDRQAQSLEAFQASLHFVINVLHKDQQDLAQRFANPTLDRFHSLSYETWDTGCPILSDALVSLECDQRAKYDGGDHVIFIGEVRCLRYRNSISTLDSKAATCLEPLLYFQGRYRQMAKLDPQLEKRG